MLSFAGFGSLMTLSVSAQNTLGLPATTINVLEGEAPSQEDKVYYNVVPKWEAKIRKSVKLMARSLLKS